MPFWSLRSRAERIIANVPAYGGFEPVEIRLAAWRSEWLPELAKDGILIGLNWSGPRGVGYDLTSADVERNLPARERLAT